VCLFQSKIGSMLLFWSRFSVIWVLLLKELEEIDRGRMRRRSFFGVDRRAREDTSIGSFRNVARAGQIHVFFRPTYHFPLHQNFLVHFVHSTWSAAFYSSPSQCSSSDDIVPFASDGTTESRGQNERGCRIIRLLVHLSHFFCRLYIRILKNINKSNLPDVITYVRISLSLSLSLSDDSHSFCVCVCLSLSRRIQFWTWITESQSIPWLCLDGQRVKWTERMDTSSRQKWFELGSALGWWWWWRDIIGWMRERGAQCVGRGVRSRLLFLSMNILLLWGKCDSPQSTVHSP